MLKKIAFLLVIICIGLAALIYQFRFNNDTTGPVIYGNSKLVYDETVTNEQLLKDVVALDDIDGDVSDTLAIESIYRISDEEAVIVYVAKDKNSNVTKSTVTLKANPPVYGVQPVEKTDENTTEEIEEETEVETEELENVAEETATPETSVETSEESSVDYYAMNEEATRAQVAIADDVPAGFPRIYLNAYVEHVSVGSTINIASYLKEIKGNKDNIFELWRNIQVEGLPDTSVAGTYETKFFVVDQEGNKSNEAVLVFIVD